MFNSIAFVRSLCQERKIPISKLEKDLGYANGYFNAKKQLRLPYDRAVEIAEYLSVSPELILTGEEKENAPAHSRSNLDDAKAAFFEGYAEELSDEEKDALWEDAKMYAKFKAQQKK